jgi:hypothetical protein
MHYHFPCPDYGMQMACFIRDDTGLLKNDRGNCQDITIRHIGMCDDYFFPGPFLFFFPVREITSCNAVMTVSMIFIRA